MQFDALLEYCTDYYTIGLFCAISAGILHDVDYCFKLLFYCFFFYSVATGTGCIKMTVLTMGPTQCLRRDRIVKQ